MEHPAPISHRRGQSRGKVGFEAGIAVGQFDEFGHHISPEELREGYKKKGLCGFCGKVKTHNRVFGIGGFIMEPLKKGENVVEGYCTNCHTLEEIYEKPEVKRKLEAKSRKGKTFPRSLSKQNVSSKMTNNSDSNIVPVVNISQKSLTISVGSCNDEGAVEMSHSPRGVDDIVKDMSFDEKNATKQAQGCNSLGQTYIQTSDDLIEGIDAIIKAMTIHPKNPEVAKEGCRAFRRFSTHPSSSGESQGSGDEMEAHVENCVAIFDRGGLKTIMAALKLFTTNRSIQREGMRVVRNLVCSVPESKDVIAENSGTKAIVAGMCANPESPSMQEDGCIILWSLSYGDTSSQRDILESNGVGVIINAMSSFVANEKVQYHACGALHTLSNSKMLKAALLEKGAFDLTVTALKEHSYSLEVVEKAMSALVNLAVSSDNSKSGTKLCVMNQEELGTVINAMQQHLEARRVQKIGCYFLELASRSRSNLKILKTHRELRALLRADAKNFPDSCANSASCILAMMDGKSPHEV